MIASAAAAAAGLAPRARTSGAPIGAAQSAFSQVEIFRTVDDAAALWSELLPRALATPYQHPAFVAAWIRHVAGPERVTPLIAVARDGAGAPVALLPLGVRRRWGVSVASFTGGSHVNYGAPVIRSDALERFTGQECLRLLRAVAAQGAVDLFELSRQPFVWEGAENPFSALPRQPSPDFAYSGPLAASLEEHLKLFVSAKSRSNQRRKMRRFEERGSPRIFRADTAQERRRLLQAYLQQKAEQFAEWGVPNVFERPGVREFLAEAAGLDGAAPVLDLYGFDLDGETIAVTGGLADQNRYCGMIISITSGEHAKYSPGEMLMNFVVEDSIRRGLRTFDLGVGAAPYKKAYCPNVEPLFDSIFGVTPVGRVAAAAIAAKTAAKARIKASPAAYALADRVRKTLGRRKAVEPVEGAGD